jgi:methylthioribose-1-phosphate isomerase
MARRAAGQDHDPSRREFFKTFSRDAIQNAGAVAGAASEIRRTTMATARELLDIDATPRPPTPAPTAGRIAASHETMNGPATFRSAYRFTGSSIVVLDQRELPGRVLTFECEAPNEVAASLRSGAVTPGPVMGQVAAYGVALAATQAVGRNAQGHEQFMRASADAIKAARGDVHAVRAAVARMIGRYDELANAASASSEIADRLTAEADEIATEATAASAEIGRRWSELLVGEELNILVHGDSGPLACGMVGMSTSALQSIITAGRRVHVWVTDASPSGEGTRVMALELTQLDIPHTVIPDSAVGWLFANRAVDAAALRGDTLASNGDSVALLGAKAVAQLAADRGVPVHVLAPEVSWDRAARDTSHLVLDMRSAAELGSAQRARLNPVFDIVPARLVSAYVSERVVVSPPFNEPR